MEPPNALVLTDSNRSLSGAILREAGKLAAFIQARVRNAADAEDVFQDVLSEFLQAYRLPGSIEHVGNWLFRVARNRIIDRFRSKKASPIGESDLGQNEAGGASQLELEVPALDGDPEAELTRIAFLEALQQALDELPVEQRRVFVAHEIEGLSFDAISSRDGVPVNTLLSRKRYAVLYLRKRLQVFYDELET